MSRINIAVMVSGHGRGSNMQAIIDACGDGRIDGQVAVVIGTKDDAPAMDRARLQDITAIEVSPKAFTEDDEYGRKLTSLMTEHKIDLICLAGYMRILPTVLISAYRYSVMNIHPALIPMFCGKGMYGVNVHQAALEYGVKVSGCTVHFVDEDYDTGPIILQKVVPVKEGDTAETLATRILAQEHIAYPEAIQLFAHDRLRIEGRIVHISQTEHRDTLA
ncbi:MAG: phosphoribosylglycinamide formyltransferase [Armatimonadota bacterium]